MVAQVGNSNASNVGPTVTIKPWSSNNGTVIYDQPNIENGYVSKMNGNGNVTSNMINYRQKENQKTQTGTAVYIDGANKATNGTMKEDNNINVLLVGNSHSPTKNSQTDTHNRKPSISLNPEFGTRKPDDDLNHDNPSNWSNGTCATSDLLF